MSTRDILKPVSIKSDWPMYSSIALVCVAYLFTPRFSYVRGQLFSTFGQWMFIAGLIAFPLGVIALKRRKDAWGFVAAVLGAAALVPGCREILRHLF